MVFNEPRVSLITPCYNGEKYLEYFFKSLEQQTYKNVEFIFINDGSTDNTEIIFNRHKSILEKKGWDIKYIFQFNAGQAAALNKGLKIFNGKYLIFPDSDDILYPNHIEEKVRFMEQNLEFGFAFCKIDVVKESNLELIVTNFSMNRERKYNLFSDLIERKNILWMPIGNIFRSSSFLEVVPERDIFSGPGGQNFQMLLPMAHKFKCGYIDKSLGKYVLRRSSHSHSYNNHLLRERQLLNIWINTINKLDDTDENRSLYIKKAVDHFMTSLYSAIKVPSKTNTFKIYLFDLIEIFKIRHVNNLYMIYLFGCKLLKIKRK